MFTVKLPELSGRAVVLEIHKHQNEQNDSNEMCIRDSSYPFLGGTDKEITNRIYNSITVVSVIYAVAAIILRICDKKLEKKELPAEIAAD